MEHAARAVLLAAVGLALAGCGGVASAPLAAGPGRPGDPRVLDDAIRGAQLAGYPALRIDAQHGRFEVVARADRSGLTRFTVQCWREGWVTVVPTEGAITHRGHEVIVSPRVRDEQRRLAAELSRVIEVRP
jgi:hypothetical protein